MTEKTTKRMAVENTYEANFHQVQLNKAKAILGKCKHCGAQRLCTTSGAACPDCWERLIALPKPVMRALESKTPELVVKTKRGSAVSKRDVPASVYECPKCSGRGKRTRTTSKIVGWDMEEERKFVKRLLHVSACDTCGGLGVNYKHN